MKKIILASTSTLYNGDYLEYLFPTLKNHFANCKTLLFIPYAKPGGISHNDYTKKVSETFLKINISVKGIHEFENTIEAIQNAEAIFTGGGNTFLLVSQLYKNDLMSVLKQTIESGTPYLGTSAGSNIGGMTMNTTNDMPIVLPESFNTLELIPFNLNPHYLDPIEGSAHMGETRETRIKEFHNVSSIPVLGLREGSWLEILDSKITLKGNLTARWFEQSKIPVEINPESDMSF
ncbi:dipeptidase PepE [Flavobacterium sp.]|uniref:dipeptidase PepE n=1 Tax=Flavobacterium sp. TaxID=239 RepID=UPI00286E9947|nr:dipeptidase PepE [Flavobacterium sp.]